MAATKAARLADGILPSQDIRELIRSGSISAPTSSPISEQQIQPASLDLRLGSVAYRIRASFLPQNGTVERGILDTGLLMTQIDLTQPTIFEKGCLYLVPLLEKLNLPEMISARANPKSSTGRLDIFTRLITDYGQQFEQVRAGYKGQLYAEIASRTFSVLVQPGMTLSQLRFAQGKPKPSDRATAALERTAKDDDQALVYRDEGTAASARINNKSVVLSVNLESTDSTEILAYKARPNAPVIDLTRVNHHDPEEFWEVKHNLGTKGLILEPGDFYILASKEKLSVPADWAAEMVAMDHGIGEFRAHYAGFFDPGFGCSASDIRGTRAVLEVRAHEVPFLIEHGQAMGRLEYLPLLSRPDKLYGADIGSSYQRQALTLSKHFKRNEPTIAATLPQPIKQQPLFDPELQGRLSMYNPSQTVRLIIDKLTDQKEIRRDIRSAADAGDPKARNVIDTQLILLHRQDLVAESYFVAAYDDYCQNRNTHTSQFANTDIQRWVEQQLPHFDRQSNALNPAIANLPWQYHPEDPSHEYNPYCVWKASGPGRGSVCEVATPIFQYEPWQWVMIKANGRLIAQTPHLAMELHSAQGTMLWVEQSLLQNPNPPILISELWQNADRIKDSLQQIPTQHHKPGPWLYRPDGNHNLNDCTIWTTDRDGHDTVADVAIYGITHTPEQWHEITANGHLIGLAPTLGPQLEKTQTALIKAAQALEHANAHDALNLLHNQVLANSPTISSARQEQLNPHTQQPIAGTPGYQHWINSHLEAIKTARHELGHNDQSTCLLYEPDRNSGIYKGKIIGQTQDFYLQLRTNDSVLTHWKGDFTQPLLLDQQYSITYNAKKANVRESTQLIRAAGQRDR